MKVLFITSTRIGDAVLGMGVLRHIEEAYPSAEVTVACGPLVVSYFEGVPCVKDIIALKKEKRNGHWIKLWKMVVGTKWDMVVDIRNSAVSRLIRAQKRFIFGGHISKDQHKVEQISQMMKFEQPVDPKLWFTDEQVSKAQELIPAMDSKVIGIGPTANWIGKTWPIERFIEVAKWLIGKGGLFEGATVAVFGAPGEEDDAKKLYDALPDGQRLNLIAKGSPGQAAACLSRLDFYMGNDSGLMHCAAAAGVTTIGVFGASYPHIYRPWGENAAFARTPETFDELIDFDGYDPKTLDHSLMVSLTVDAVKDVIESHVKKVK